MSWRWVASSLIAALSFAASSTQALPQNQNEVWKEISNLHWQFSGVGAIGDLAGIQIPNNYIFLGAYDTRRFLELNGNLPSDNAYAIGPKDLRWFGVFEFENSGYVPDDERLDPDELLNILKRYNGEQQAEMRRRGLVPLTLIGWFVEPHYDLATKRLEWGTRLKAETGDAVVNYTIKLLGRHGVMDAILVSDPQSLDRDVREFKAVLRGYSFNQGERYSEYRAGDKVAEYGLAALIVGGAAAAAAKSGAFKGLAKLLWVGGVAVVAGIAGFFKKVFRKA